jgi:hypothetical protein
VACLAGRMRPGLCSSAAYQTAPRRTRRERRRAAGPDQASRRQEYFLQGLEPQTRGLRAWLQGREMAPPADEFRPHMSIFEARAGHESWPHLLPPARLQAAPRGGPRGGARTRRPNFCRSRVGPALVRKWGHKSPAEPRARADLRCVGMRAMIPSMEPSAARTLAGVRAGHKSLAVGGSRSQPMTLLYSSALRLTGPVVHAARSRGLRA